jgi:hypothetical protein
MVAMGGGPDIPSRTASNEKEIVLCALPWPEERAQKGIAELTKTFPNIEVHYVFTRFENGKMHAVDVPEGV